MSRSRPKLIGWRMVAVCFVVGLVLNVLTAWGLVVWLRASDPGQPHLVTTYRAADAFEGIEVGAQSVDPSIAWPAGAPDMGDEPAAAMGRWRWPRRPGASSVSWWAELGGPFVVSWRAGFPARSLESFTGWFEPSFSVTQPPPEHAWGLDMGWPCRVHAPHVADTVHLPLRPMWGGFVVNTVFYGALLLVAVVVARWVRRRGRARRGLCIGCGYELAGLGVCPECGIERSA